MNFSFELLSKLSAKEVQGFKQHLQTGATQRDTALSQIVIYWEKQHSSTFTNEAAFKKGFPNKTFTDQAWYTAMTYLQGELEYFLSSQLLKRDKLLQKRLLLRLFRQRNLRRFFERVYRQFHKIITKLAPYETHHKLIMYEGQEAYYDYVASQSRKKPTNLQVLSEQLDVFFVIEKLKQICRQYSRTLINKRESYDIRFATIIPEVIEQDEKLLEHPVIRLYHSCWKAVVQNGPTDAFLRFHEMLLTPPKGVSKQDMRDLFLMAANYSIRRLNQGDDSYGIITLDLYKHSLALGYLLENGELPANTFSNIVSLGLQQKHFDWSAEFIQQYKDITPLPIRASLVGLCQARLHYSIGQAEEGLSYLLRAGTMTEPWLYLSAQSLKLKIFYELDSFDLLNHQLDNFQRYLQRTPLGYHAYHYQQLVHFLRRLVQLTPGDRMAYAQLEKDIIADEKFLEKEWLIRMLKK